MTQRPMVGVVGAGTMGAGIAQVAAAAGHRVLLMDARAGAALQAHAGIDRALSGLVTKQKMTAEARAALLSRIEPVDSFERFADAGLVVEAILEQLEAKRILFADLEKIVSAECILATNTSSLSITAIARDLEHPARFAGMHFFNPVPQMRLVEVVSGLATSPSTVATIRQLAQDWGKTPVLARSTPGFIVNRIARPFYAEALALLNEQRATAAQLDAAMRGAGFRMGPCELMDLIGHDINYAVTDSVFRANYGDQRFQPSGIQRELVEGGLLGRKSSRGFYSYANNSPVVAATPTACDTQDPEIAGTVIVCGSGAVPDGFATLLRAAGVSCSRQHEGPSCGLVFTGQDGRATSLWLTDGRPAGKRALAHANPWQGVFDLPLKAGLDGALAVAFAQKVPATARRIVRATLARAGIETFEIGDAPGLVVARTIAMLINEAADAVQQGVCSVEAANTAMRLGTNYPAGPFEWLAHLGSDYVIGLLDQLDAIYRGERYRVSPWLLERRWAEAADTSSGAI